MFTSVLTKLKRTTKTIPTKEWEYKFQYIRKKWEGTPAIIKTFVYNDFHTLKQNTPLTVGKNEIVIALTYWQANNSDILTITKGNLFFEYPLGNLRFTDLTDKELSALKLLPQAQIYCNQCLEFSTSINSDGLCLDCLN